MKRHHNFIANEFLVHNCGPCKMLSPTVEKVANEIKSMKFAKVNVDNELELSQRFDVISIPTLIFFKGKEQIDRVVRVISDEL